MIDELPLTLAGDFYTNEKQHKFCINCYESKNLKVKLKPIYVAIRDEDTNKITDEWTEYTCPKCNNRVKP